MLLDHMQIDIDGMKKILADRRLKSLALELLPEHRRADRDAINTVLGFGFHTLHEKMLQDGVPPWPEMCFFARI